MVSRFSVIGGVLVEARDRAGRQPVGWSTDVVVARSASVRYWVTTVSPPTAPIATPAGSLSRVTLPS